MNADRELAQAMVAGRPAAIVFISPLSGSSGMCVLKEKAEHLARGIRSARIGVRPGRTAARPGMAGAADDPLFKDRPATGIDIERAAVGVPAGHLTVLH